MMGFVWFFVLPKPNKTNEGEIRGQVREEELQKEPTTNS
jgi:hypothetical protein